MARGGVILYEWGKAVEVACVGLSGVFAALFFLKICVNIISVGVRAVEKTLISK